MTPTPARATRRVAIAPTGDRFELGGQPWFQLSDTAWSAFTDIPLDEWERYVALRAGQGFTALNISILPILHDASASPTRPPEPFEGFRDGSPRFGALRRDYITRAGDRLAVMAAHDLVPNLVLLWCNYVPETWASVRDPRFVMGVEARADYVACVVEAFDGFSPMYVVAGDGDMATEASREAWTAAQRRLVGLVPNAVTTMHTQDTAVLPADMAADAALGYYCYQSGHRRERQSFSWQYAELYREAVMPRPVVNLEPCYEGHGFGFQYGRFDAAAVRRASWQSLLAGASAGLGYGAHGVWQWHRRGAAFTYVEFSGMPFDRWTATAFPGAIDVAFAAELMAKHRLIGAAPRQDLIRTAPAGVRAAVGDDPTRVAIYTPYATSVALSDELTVADVSAWDLATRQRASATVAVEADGPVVEQLEANSDALFIVTLDGPVAPSASPISDTRRSR